MSAKLPEGVSVVVPVYNSEKTISALCDRLIAVLEPMGRFEIILVEDCGKDDSWTVVRGLASGDARIHGFRMSRNYGQHSALLCGIRAARFATCVTIDDDLQQRPEVLPELIELLEAGNDVVYGTPAKERHGILRDLASRITKIALTRAMGAETAQSVSALRVMRTELRDAFADFRGPFVSLDVLLTWATTRFAAKPVPYDPRAEGESNYTFWMLVTHAFNMLTGFTAVPLQIATFIGFVMALFGFLVLAYVIFQFLRFGHAVPGFTFLASVIAIFSGAQLFSIGMIGEYLARMHFRQMDKPTYIVRETT